MNIKDGKQKAETIRAVHHQRSQSMTESKALACNRVVNLRFPFSPRSFFIQDARDLL